ncbi:beta-aspartyl-peptidase [Marinobacter salinisoli]|uniref:Isoaspartyl dipeptidase n=1 Tax=Marinobacter salinisoli TaxID=2769486 RepID=A0ABX7MRT1_9GAMM|nr:beta-aspartyl-peptidase [Marinobacter salinisoli]QSP95082.1 beta-aspartyl-peptidase [Marinobacter salinisoli]
MLTLIRGAQVLAPESLGVQDVLVAGATIVAIGPDLSLAGNVEIDEIDGTGCYLTPGLVDTLTHITGGGGEGGFNTRTPAMELSDAVRGGVTTVTGVLGTDSVSRTLPDLLAKAAGLEADGLTVVCHTGSYHVPIKTLMGSIQQDLMLVERFVGVGEVAIADHRGSQPHWRELARIGAEARTGGLLSGKAGIVSVHVGEGKDGLDLLFAVAEHSSVPLSQYYPTHMNRSTVLLDQGVRFVAGGGYIDLTASHTPEILAAGEVKCASALKYLLDQGADENRITFSTDGHASLPHFNEAGVLESLKVGSMASMHEEFRDAVMEDGVSLTAALKAVTANPASVLKLDRKGRIAQGLDADLLLLDQKSLEIRRVMARGQWAMIDGQVVLKGMFEAR